MYEQMLHPLLNKSRYPQRLKIHLNIVVKTIAHYVKLRIFNDIWPVFSWASLILLHVRLFYSKVRKQPRGILGTQAQRAVLWLTFKPSGTVLTPNY